MLLAGKGRRTAEQSIELDHLDTNLRALLGEAGLLSLAGSLLGLMAPAVQAAVIFGQERVSHDDLFKLQLALEGASDVGWSRLQHTPIPLDGPGLAELAHRAGTMAAALLDLDSEANWWSRWLRGSQLADRSCARLLTQLAGRASVAEVWPAVRVLLDPEGAPPAERLQRVRLCYRLAGLAASIELARQVGKAFHQVAELVSAGLADKTAASRGR
jgi:hypothetical protein